MAIETLKSGAADYVLKARLSRHLIPAIRGALREAEERRKRTLAEQGLRESEERFRLLVEDVKDYALCILDPQGHFVNWNSGAEWMLGYAANDIIFVNEAGAGLLGANGAEQLIGKPMKDIVTPKHWERFREDMRRLREEGTTRFFLKPKPPTREKKTNVSSTEVLQFVRLDGTLVSVVAVAAPLTFQDRPAVIVFAYDIRLILEKCRP